eukprot:scaffold1834_cov331-Prasinococcus_capsulatus_cf.AAC.1
MRPRPARQTIAPLCLTWSSRRWPRTAEAARQSPAALASRPARPAPATAAAAAAAVAAAVVAAAEAASARPLRCCCSRRRGSARCQRWTRRRGCVARGARSLPGVAGAAVPAAPGPPAAPRTARRPAMQTPRRCRRRHCRSCYRHSPCEGAAAAPPRPDARHCSPPAALDIVTRAQGCLSMRRRRRKPPGVTRARTYQGRRAAVEQQCRQVARRARLHRALGGGGGARKRLADAQRGKRVAGEVVEVAAAPHGVQGQLQHRRPAAPHQQLP